DPSGLELRRRNVTDIKLRRWTVTAQNHCTHIALRRRMAAARTIDESTVRQRQSEFAKQMRCQPMRRIFHREMHSERAQISDFETCITARIDATKWLQVHGYIHR